jgi:hypothetical protein
MQFHHHPDGLVYVRGEGVVYCDTPQNFAADWGHPYEFAGRERIYEPGIRHFVDNEPQPLEWAQGDAYIAGLPSLLQAQYNRLYPAPTLEQARAAAVAEVNRQAGEARSRVGTNIPFQGDLYQMKGDEAARWAVDTEPTAAKYPIMYAEAAARGMEPAAVQAEYAANAQAWPQIMAAIEAVRMGSRAQLAAAETVEEIAEILAAVVWPV